jgi:hypothetical protein
MGMMISVVQWKVTIKSDSQSLSPAIATFQFIKDIGAAILVPYDSICEIPSFLKQNIVLFCLERGVYGTDYPFTLFGEWGSVLLQP